MLAKLTFSRHCVASAHSVLLCCLWSQCFTVLPVLTVFHYVAIFNVLPKLTVSHCVGSSHCVACTQSFAVLPVILTVLPVRTVSYDVASGHGLSLCCQDVQSLAGSLLRSLTVLPVLTAPHSVATAHSLFFCCQCLWSLIVLPLLSLLRCCQYSYCVARILCWPCAFDRMANIFFFNIDFYWCNLQIQVVSMILVRSD